MGCTLYKDCTSSHPAPPKKIEWIMPWRTINFLQIFRPTKLTSWEITIFSIRFVDLSWRNLGFTLKLTGFAIHFTYFFPIFNKLNKQKETYGRDLHIEFHLHTSMHLKEILITAVILILFVTVFEVRMHHVKFRNDISMYHRGILI